MYRVHGDIAQIASSSMKDHLVSIFAGAGTKVQKWEDCSAQKLRSRVNGECGALTDLLQLIAAALLCRHAEP